MGIWASICRFCHRKETNHHAEIEERLTDQERWTDRAERRIKRVEIELGIVHPEAVDKIEGTAA